jgi:hypothetical protein
MLLKEAQLEKQGLRWVSGFGRFLVLLAFRVVPNEPDVLRLGMPAQSSWEFGSFPVLHVNYFLQISNSVKLAAVACFEVLADIPSSLHCQLYSGAFRQVYE